MALDADNVVRLRLVLDYMPWAGSFLLGVAIGDAAWLAWKVSAPMVGAVVALCRRPRR